jgi:hypothetical protein
MGRYTSDGRTTPEKACSKGAPCAPPRDRFVLCFKLLLERFMLRFILRFVSLRFTRRVISTKKEENYEGS